MSYLSIEVKSLTQAMDDDAIVALVKEGDAHAFRDLWNRHNRKLFRLALRIVKNTEDAEDVIQESFLKAYTHLEGFDGRAKFSTWMTRIVINGALQLLRKRRSTIAMVSIDSGSEDEDYSWDVPDHTPDALTNCLKAERDGMLVSAIGKLPENLRCILELQLAHEGPVSDIAYSAGISVPAAKSRLMRARSNLRRSLNPRSRVVVTQLRSLSIRERSA